MENSTLEPTKIMENHISIEVNAGEYLVYKKYRKYSQNFYEQQIKFADMKI
jgi:hypothetical protein